MIMRQEMQQTTALRVWRYISKPFQITKVLEILYTLDWIWYALLSIIPDNLVRGSVLQGLQSVLSANIITAALLCIVFSHTLALLMNIIVLRKINLMLNIAILLYISVKSLQSLPISGGIGYIIILAGVSIFAFLRMDESH